MFPVSDPSLFSSSLTRSREYRPRDSASKSFICDIDACGKSFYHRRNLVRHQKTAHQGVKQPEVHWGGRYEESQGGGGPVSQGHHQGQHVIFDSNMAAFSEPVSAQNGSQAEGGLGGTMRNSDDGENIFEGEEGAGEDDAEKDKTERKQCG